MKRLVWIMSLTISLVSSAYAGQYVLSVDPGVTAKFLINNNSTPIVASQQNNLKTPFTGDLFAEGVLTASIPSKQGVITNTCHITLISDSKWVLSAYTGDQCDFIKPTQSNVIHVTQPKLVQQKITASQFEPLVSKRVYLLDYQPAYGGNMLFRTNMPLTRGQNQQIDFQKLIDTFAQRFKQQVPDGQFPKKFQIIDVSIISNGEHSELIPYYREYLSFGGKATNPEAISPNEYQPLLSQAPYKISVDHYDVTGRVLWWPVEPILMSQAPFNNKVSDVQKSLALTGKLLEPHKSTVKDGNLPVLIQLLSNLMTTKHHEPYIIFIHCTDGRDRTSIVGTSYLMYQYNLSLEKAYSYGSTILDGNQKVRFVPIKSIKGHLNTMQWYCLYLRQKPGYSNVNNCGNKMDNRTTLPDYPWN